MDSSEQGWDRPARRRRPGGLWLAVGALAVAGGVVLAGGNHLTGKDDGGQLSVERNEAEDADAGRTSLRERTSVNPLREGLAHNVIWSLAVAEDGTVWAGTSRGLSRFDGEEWITDRRQHGPGGDAVISVATGPDADVWAVTQGAGGVSVFDGEDWTRYTEGNGFAKFATGVTVTPEGVAWATSPDALWRFDGQAWEQAPGNGGFAQQAGKSAAATGAGQVWVTTYDGLFRFDGQAWRGYTTEDGLASETLALGAVAVAGDGSVWVGMRGGVSRFAEGEWTSYTSADGLVDDAVTSVAVAGDGTVWVGTRGGGVSRFAEGEWTSYTDDGGFVTRLPAPRAGPGR